MKQGLNSLFLKSKQVLDKFATVMETMKIRMILDDELDILVELCHSLITFHSVLITLDFRSACRCWQLYTRLAKKHVNRLSMFFFKILFIKSDPT